MCTHAHAHTHSTASTPSSTSQHARGAAPTTRRLLLCGVVGGILFPVLSVVQAGTRDGFDLRRHAFSALTLGDLGWVQVATFVVTGLLVLALAVGVLRMPGARPAALPWLLAVSGAGMIGGGLFTPDPQLGWPAGAPAGVVADLSTRALLHVVCGVAAFTSLIVGSALSARWSLARVGRGWAAYSAASSAATAALTCLPWGASSDSIRFAVASVVVFGWLALLSRRLRG